MAILFPNTSVSEVGSGIVSIPGTFIQIVEGVITSTFSTTTVDTWTQLGTASITLTSASNSVYVYWNGNFRKDQTQGQWSLCLCGLYYNTGGAFLSHSGWNGGWRHTINSFRKLYIHTPGSVGPHTYSIRFYNHNPGTTSAALQVNTGTASDQRSYIRLMEIAA